MTRRDRDDLLLCPFCGGRATEEITQEHTANPKHRVLCMDCGCSTPKTVASPMHVYWWNTSKKWSACNRCPYHEPNVNNWCILSGECRITQRGNK